MEASSEAEGTSVYVVTHDGEEHSATVALQRGSPKRGIGNLKINVYTKPITPWLSSR